MFFGDQLFQIKKKDPLSLLWLAGSSLTTRKLTKQQIMKCDISQFGQKVQKSKDIIHRLRITGTLLLGLVVIYRRQTEYLITEMKNAMNKARLDSDVSNMAMISKNIDLPKNMQQSNRLTLPENNDNNLVNILNESYYNEMFFNNKGYLKNLKSLLQRGYETEFGLNIDFSLGFTPNSRLSQDNAILTSPNNNNGSEIGDPLSSIKLKASKKDKNNMMNDEEINFGDLIDGGEEEEIGMGGGGGDEIILPGEDGMSEDILFNQIEGLNKRMSMSGPEDQKRTGKKRKRKLKSLIDEETELSNEYIRAGIANTDDIVRTRKKMTFENAGNKFRGMSMDYSTDQFYTSFRKMDEDLPLKKRIEDYYYFPELNLRGEVAEFYESVVKNKRAKKKRKLNEEEEFKTPEMMRSKNASYDEYEIGMGGGGGDEIFLEDEEKFDDEGEGSSKKLRARKGKESDVFDFDEKKEAEFRLSGNLPLTPNNDAFDKFITLKNVSLLMDPPKDLTFLSYKFLIFLRKAFNNHEGEEILDWQKIMDTKDKRVIGVAFYHTLILAKNDYVLVSQENPYDRIFIKKGGKFDL